MGLLRRLFTKPDAPPPPRRPDLSAYQAATADFERAMAAGITITVRAAADEETLYVVGESYRQDVLWRIVGGVWHDEVRMPILAELQPEPTNEHDHNAIAVLIDSEVVGYLSRHDAALYRPGIERLIASHGKVQLHGLICGGSPREDGLGLLGVFLDHDPADFGIQVDEPEHATLADLPAGYGFRTGLSSARATDLEDDSYDLSWIDGLSTNVATAITQLRKLLESENDPIDRHYMYAELEARLYGCRDAFVSALDDYDDVCRQHDAAIGEIRVALFAKFGRLPILETYKQSAIRCAKAKQWEAAARWCEHGVEVYAGDAARADVVEDLRKRLAHARTKIEQRDRPTAAPRRRPGVVTSAPLLEQLVCQVCGRSFERLKTPGRKPHACPDCRGVISNVAPAT